MGSSCKKCTFNTPRGNMTQLIFSPQNRTLFKSGDLHLQIERHQFQNIANDNQFQDFVRTLFPDIQEEIQHHQQFINYLKDLFQFQKDNSQRLFQHQLSILIKCLLINRSIFKEDFTEDWLQIYQAIHDNSNAMQTLMNGLNSEEMLEIPENSQEQNPETNAQTPINNSSYNLALRLFVNKLFCHSHELIQSQFTFLSKLDQLHQLWYSQQNLLFIEQFQDLIKNLTEANQPFEELNQDEWQIIKTLIETDRKHINNLIQVHKEYETKIITLEQSSPVNDQVISRSSLDSFILTLFSVEIKIIHNQSQLMIFLEQLFKLLQERQYIQFVRKFEVFINSLTLDKNLFSTIQQFEWIQLSIILQDQPNYIAKLIEALSTYKLQIIKEQKYKNRTANHLTQ